MKRVVWIIGVGLVLLAGPKGGWFDGKPLNQYIYLVDPESGKARLTWRGQ